MKLNRLLTGFLAGCVAVSMCAMSAFALSHSITPDDAKIFQNNENLSAAASELGLQINGTEVTVSDKKLAELTGKEQQEKMDNFIAELTNANISQESTTQISEALTEGYENTANVNVDIMQVSYIFNRTKGDLLGAMGIISPFLPIINLIIGVVAIMVAAVLVLSTVIDLAFIGLPMVRESMMAGDDKQGSNDKKPKALTYACWATINDVEGALGGGGGAGSGGKSYKNAYGLYFKRRAWDYILLGVCLSFLIFGGFGRLMNTLLGIGKQLSPS